jgi:branched-chain amino acid transport system ATP-binding protein
LPELFPALPERRRATRNRLSGGEQQTLVTGRALVGGPKVLLLDEPLEGLAPIVVETLFGALAAIRDDSGVTMALAEQKADLALSFAEDAGVLDRGRAVFRWQERRVASGRNAATPLAGGRRAMIKRRA